MRLLSQDNIAPIGHYAHKGTDTVSIRLTISSNLIPNFTVPFFILFGDFAGLGFEPRYSVPETDVLPLDDPAAVNERSEFYCCVDAGYYRRPQLAYEQH
jgi:hypothetical protein